MEGINSRLDGLQAAILNVKLPHLNSWTNERRRVAARYDQLLKGIGNLVLPTVGSLRSHVYHLYVVRTPQRDRLKKYLGDLGIPTALNYPKALPFYPAYAHLGHKPEDFPVAHANQSLILSLPIYPEMTDAMLVHVARAIEEFFATAAL